MGLSLQVSNMQIVPSVWGSLIHFSNELINEARQTYGDIELQSIDWESHANIHELPDSDLIGPTALNITEDSPQMFEINFSVAVSSWKTDTNLFRMRHYLALAFERMRVGKQIAIYDSETAEKIGYMVMTNGTLLAPMSRAETRPWQYVQGSALLEPVLT